jgi:hypothetical protein
MRTAWILAPAALAVGLGLMALAAEPDKTPAKAAPVNLIPNGDFEAGDGTPTGWQTVDGLTSYWVKDDDPKHGKVIKFDTDVYQQEGYDWWVKIAQGKATAKDAPKKTMTVGDKYDTIAGNDGVWFWSDPIPVDKGKAYWLTIDAKGPAMMAWLFGYPEKPKTDFGADEGAFQEYLTAKISGKPKDVSRGHESFIHNYVWKGQLSTLGGSDEWKTYSREKMPFRPTAHTPNVKYVRVMILPTWPPGVYTIDNVKLTEIEDKGDDAKP